MDQLGGLLYLFLTVCIGYGAAATKLLSEKAAETLPQLLFNICYPAMILETFLTVDTSVLLGTGLPIAAATVAVTLVLFVSGLWAFRKQPEEQKALYTFLMGVGNVTYVAIPLFSALLPAEAVLAAIIHSTAQDPLIWGIYHPLLLKSTEGQKKYAETGAEQPLSHCHAGRHCSVRHRNSSSGLFGEHFCSDQRRHIAGGSDSDRNAGLSVWIFLLGSG